MIEAYVQARGIEAYGVVTSGFHMPRCRYIFGCLAGPRQIEFIAADDPPDIGEAVREHEAVAIGLLVEGMLHPQDPSG